VGKFSQENFNTENISPSKVYQWMERFQSARTSDNDEDHLGRLTTSRTADNVEVRVTVQEDRYSRKVAHEL
jgi:hypothetical protein